MLTRRTGLALAAALALAAVQSAAVQSAAGQSAGGQSAEWVEAMAATHQLTDQERGRLREVLAASPYIGQGNPAITRHPATPAQCDARLVSSGISYENPGFEAICGDRYMAPLYDPSTETAGAARACIDQFEFPNMPCAYPVVWVRAREAAQLCEAVGKRLCDAHEWEGACAGALTEPDYDFALAAGVTPATAVNRLRLAHNRRYDDQKTWSYGPEYRTGVCATSSRKSPSCDGGNWDACGSNTFPAGMFPECRSALSVYDLHGNAAEHMNLPLRESDMASRGTTQYGYTEMKGSWFIFDSYRAHEDACRWRAPYWHGSRVMDPMSHHNYHLGFRCCKTLEGE